MITKTPQVHYKKPVSDTELKLILQRIAETLGRDINVHSGDRDYRRKGSPPKSLHLSHRAADLHVPGLIDIEVFNQLRNAKDKIFAGTVNSYQVIRHCPHTETEAAHIHIGHYHFIRSFVTGPGVSFFVEGLTPGTKGKYTKVP
jgi:uncharacterized protein YcbK (DUF882 family)